MDAGAEDVPLSAARRGPGRVMKAGGRYSKGEAPQGAEPEEAEPGGTDLSALLEALRTLPPPAPAASASSCRKRPASEQAMAKPQRRLRQKTTPREELAAPPGSTTGMHDQGSQCGASPATQPAIADTILWRRLEAEFHYPPDVINALFEAMAEWYTETGAKRLSSCLRQPPPPCQPSPVGGGCPNYIGYGDADDNVAGDDDDDDGDDDDDHDEEEAELALE